MASSINDTESLPTHYVEKKLTKHPLWKLTNDNKLSRQFRAKNFKSAMDFLDIIGRISEKYRHHPDVHLAQSKDVEVRNVDVNTFYPVHTNLILTTLAFTTLS